jgi:peptidoglycan/LPS O-acetylase OafA/YrhL
LRWLVLLTERTMIRMDLLFLLSGFLMAYVYIQKHEQIDFKIYRAFLWERLTRFYPPYLAALLVLIFIVGVGRLLGFPDNDSYSLKALPFRLALLQAWPFFSWAKWQWNTPTWFLSALWFAYLFAFPCVWKLFPKLRASRFALLGVFSPVLLYVLVDRFDRGAQYSAVLQACCGVISGGALCALYVEQKRLVAVMQRHLDTIALLFLASFVLMVLVPVPAARENINSLLVLACPVLLAGLTAQRSMTASLLATRPFMWIGKISYSLFITNKVILKPLKVLLPPDRFADSPLPVRYAILAFYVFAILIFAVAMHELVEVPCTRALKRHHARRPSNSPERFKPVPQRATVPILTAPSPTRSEDI